MHVIHGWRLQHAVSGLDHGRRDFGAIQVEELAALVSRIDLFIVPRFAECASSDGLLVNDVHRAGRRLLGHA